MQRRDLLRMMGLSLSGASLSGWMPSLARAAGPAAPRHCILLWMPGGASQLDTFDMKPGHENGGEFQEVQTSVPGLRISEHLPQLAARAEHLAIVRSLSTAEGDHSRGTYLMHTGQRPMGPIAYPTIGASLSKALGSEQAELPNFVSISPYTAFNRAAFGPGFLGPRHAPLTVGAVDVFQRPQTTTTGDYAELGVDDLQAGVSLRQQQARLKLWGHLQDSFLADHPTAAPVAQQTVYERAVRMMNSQAAQAFDLSREPDKVREAYGRGRFGQGCLMARRLIERGVSFIEVALRGSAGGALGWDTHAQNFARVRSLSEELDAGWSALLDDLQQRGLLESTTICWLGEFGRTPKINRNGGRDHYPKAWTSVLAGGGVQGGQAFGATSADGGTVEQRQVGVADLLATLSKAVGVEPATQNISELGRPIRIADGQPIGELLADS